MSDSDNGFIKGVVRPRRTRNVKSAPFSLDGDFEEILRINREDDPAEDILGTFIGARISKQGGLSNNTTVLLLLDGQAIVSMSFKKAKTLGLRGDNNPYGIVLFKGKNSVNTMTISFQVPLFFFNILQVLVRVQEEDVSGIEAEVVWGRGHEPEPGDGEPPSDDDDDVPFP